MPFSVLAPVTAMATMAASPAAVPQAPPTVVAVTLIASGKVRAVPLTLTSVTTGAVRSTDRLCAPVVPVFAAASDCVAMME